MQEELVDNTLNKAKNIQNQKISDSKSLLDGITDVFSSTAETIGVILKDVLSIPKTLINGILTNTDKPKQIQTKSTLDSSDNTNNTNNTNNNQTEDKSKNLDENSEISEYWAKFKTNTSKVGETLENVLDTSTDLIKDLLWDRWVKNYEETKETYKKHWNNQEKQFPPVEEKNYKIVLFDGKERNIINEGLEVIAESFFGTITKLLNKLLSFAKFIGDYLDPYDPDNDPTKPLESLMSQIKEVINNLKPLESLGLKIPGLNELLEILNGLMEVTFVSAKVEMEVGNGKLFKKPYKFPKIPEEFLETINAVIEAFKSLMRKLQMFPVWIVFKCIEIIIKFLEILGLTLIPPLNLIADVLKLLDTCWKLVSNGPLMLKNIIDLILNKLCGLWQALMMGGIPVPIVYKDQGLDNTEKSNTETDQENEKQNKDTLNAAEKVKKEIKQKIESAETNLEENLNKVNFDINVDFNDYSAIKNSVQNSIQNVVSPQTIQPILNFQNMSFQDFTSVLDEHVKNLPPVDEHVESLKQ